jgi:hypothetical protein
MRLWWVLALIGCGSVEKVKPDAQRVADSPVAIDARADARPLDAPPDSPAGHVVPPNPALWLRMDDSPTDGALDSAATPHTATCTACPTVTAGQFSSAYMFSSHDIDVANAADLAPNTGFTVATWVRLDAAPSGSVTVVACKNQGSLDCTYGLLIENTGVPGFYSQGAGHLMGPTVLAVGAWHHLTMTWDGTTKVGYVDGVQVASIATAAPASDTGALSVGNRPASPLPLIGTIDDFVFYDRVLTAAEITSLATP